jgi:tetratricopeptide (TPR) repeat protein
MSRIDLVLGKHGGVWAAIVGTLVGVAAVRSTNAAEPAGDDVSPLDRILGPEQVAAPGPAREADPPRSVDVDDEVAIRPPAPPLADIAAAEKRVREAYGADLQQVRDPVLRRNLFDELIGAARGPDTPAPERWAAMELAREIAAEAGEATLVRRALETRVASFADQDWLGPMMAFLQAARNAGLKRGSPELFEAALDVNREALAAARRDADRVAIASEAIMLAAEMLPNLPANDQDRFRPLVRTQQERTDEITAICQQAAAARGVLQGNPDDHAANAAVGFAAAWAGDWVTAADHLRRTKDRKLKAAAEKEAAAAQPLAPAEAFGLAESWWDAVVEDGQNQAAVILAPRPPPQPTLLVRQAIRVHAADFYEKALPDLNQLNRKLAEKRIEEAAKAERGKHVAEDPEENPIRNPVLIAEGPAFDEDRFNAAEQNRAKLFLRLGDAVAEGRGSEIARLQRELTTVREEWAGSLHLQNRDPSLPRKKELVAMILRQDPGFADGWLCDCYLELLAGNRGQARVSLDKAERLMDREPARQLFCGHQLLDAGQALVVLGDVDGAQRLSNTLRKVFAQDPGVRFLEARIDIEKRLLGNADAVLRKLARVADASPTVTAEYAWFKAANPTARLRNQQEAEQAIQQTLNAKRGPLWKALRAQSALLAADGRWDEAIKTLDRAAEQAPLVFAEDIAAQRQAYVERESFFFNTIK